MEKPLEIKTIVAWAQRAQINLAEANGLEPWDRPESAPWKSLVRWLTRAQGRRVIFRDTSEPKRGVIRDLVVARTPKGGAHEDTPAPVSTAPGASQIVPAAAAGEVDRVWRRVNEVEDSLLRRVRQAEEAAEEERRAWRRATEDLRRELAQAVEELGRVKRRLAELGDGDDATGGIGGIVQGIRQIASLGASPAAVGGGQPWRSGPGMGAVQGSGAAQAAPDTLQGK